MSILPTSLRGSRSRALPTDESGVTLIELMVVITIVVGLMGAGIYSMGLITQADMKNEVRRLTSAITFTWSRAAMNNAQYRLVLDLDKDSYHTEVTNAPVVAEESDDEDESSDEFVSERARQAQEKSEQKKSSNDQENSPFDIDKKPSYDKVKASELAAHTLAGDLRIDRVIPCNREDPVTEGRAAIHFYPNGFQEPAIIVLQNGTEGGYFSLKTEPLTGEVKVVDKELKETEDCGQPYEEQGE